MLFLLIYIVNKNIKGNFAFVLSPVKRSPGPFGANTPLLSPHSGPNPFLPGSRAWTRPRTRHRVAGGRGGHLGALAAILGHGGHLEMTLKGPVYYSSCKRVRVMNTPLPSNTLLKRKTRVYRGTIMLLIFALKHRL